MVDHHTDATDSTAPSAATPGVLPTLALCKNTQCRVAWFKPAKHEVRCPACYGGSGST